MATALSGSLTGNRRRMTSRRIKIGEKRNETRVVQIPRCRGSSIADTAPIRIGAPATIGRRRA